jgi:arabinofuranan 3-O-arabinosyltransferase
VRIRSADRPLFAVIAAVAYIPMFFSRPGQVVADTKQYLYLDPAKLTAGAAFLWDPNQGTGTVTHQNIGYLLPMGPFYSLVSWLGIPMWVGQRIWMGSLVAFAGLGVAYCARRLGLEGPGRAVAALAYMLSPYILVYVDRTTALLMPWAALGWMVGLVATAARTGRWRHVALFALVVALVGGVNATSILLVIAAPAVWLAYAVWATGEITLRRALITSARLAVSCTLVSLWWAAGLLVEAKYGINILRVTETIPTVSSTSSAAEVLRGLGYWYFYGWDKVQPWTISSIPYTQSPWLIAVSFTVPGVALVLGMLTRWAYRGFCLATVALGTAVAVGAYPFAHPSLLGALIKGASAGSELAMAMRSVDRIVPIVVLGLALMMGSGVTALRLQRPKVGTVAALGCVALIAADIPAVWTGGLVGSNQSRSAVPSYWTQAAAYLNSFGSSTRVLGLPGEDFAAYAFGVTVDQLAPGLLDRPYVQRQVQPMGSPASANLLQALDEPIQEGTLDMAALAPTARLMSVGQILLQSDLQYERYHLPFPKILYADLTSGTAGLGAPVNFGASDVAAQIRYPLDTELRLGIPTGTPEPPALSVFNVSGARPIDRVEPTANPIVLAGDGSGIVEAAGAGLLGGNQPIFYAASSAGDAKALSELEKPGSTLVLTDTNPDATYQWGSLQANVGQVEQPGVKDLALTASDYALPVFPGESPADQTVAVVAGVKSVQASQYGDSLSLTPEGKPINAFLDVPGLAWTFGAHEAVGGIYLLATLDAPVTTNHVVLHQLTETGPNKRRITSVTLSFDGKYPIRVDLGPASLSKAGQIVSFPTHTFTTFRLSVDGATGGAHGRYDGLPAVGFTDISIPGVPHVSESLLLPTDLLTAAGTKSLSDPLDILMNRQRVSGPPRSDPEPFMSRTFDLPTSRSFEVSGAAEINAGDSDYLINQLVGLTPPGRLPPTQPASTPGPAVVVAANSSTRLDEDRNARANAAFDDNPATAWQAELGPQAGEWLSATLSKPITFDHLNFVEVNDGRHSLPSRITITAGGRSDTVNVPVPPVGTGRPAGATSTVELNFAPLTGSTIKLTVDSVHQVRALDYYSTYAGLTDELPVGIAEVGLPNVVAPAPPANLPAVCQSGLLKIDGKPIDVEVTGTTKDALNGDEMTIHGCGNSAHGVTLGPGPHSVVTSLRLPSGWSIDQLWLSSGAGGGAVPLGSTVAPAQSAPVVTVTAQTRTAQTVSVKATGKPMWLVLGESYDPGWTASVSGGPSLGAPKLIDAMSNGWLLPAEPAGKLVSVTLTFAPQTLVWVGLGVSAFAIIVLLTVVAWPEPAGGGWEDLKAGGWGRSGRRRRKRWPDTPPPPSRFSPVKASMSALLGRQGPGSAVASWRDAIGAGIAWGLVTAVVTRPAIASGAGLAVLCGCRWDWGRTASRILAVGGLVTLPAYAVWEQVTYHYWPSIAWPSQLTAANDIAWASLALIGGDLAAGWARWNSARRRAAVRQKEAG